MVRARRLAPALLAALAAGTSTALADGLPAFPGAEGYGADTPGGRGGAVLFVDNLNDSGPGSLRAAVSASGPRTVLFRTGGTITLRSPLRITEPFLTIAGQTAPGDGIQIRNNPDGIDDARAGVAADSFESIVIDTHDVVIRHLRVRPGPLTENPACTGPNAVDTPPSVPSTASTCVDANDIRAIGLDAGARDVVLDHLSLSWSSDELVSLQGATNVTLQWSILSEGMNWVLYGGHFAPPESFSGKGIITGDNATASNGIETSGLSVHHNAWAHNSARSPQMTNHCIDGGTPLPCASDTINNVTYNWWKFGILSGNILGHHFGNVVGNYVKEGPDSPNLANGLRLIDYTTLGVVEDADIRVHYADNRSYAGPGETAAMAVACQVWNPGASVYDPCDIATYDRAARYGTPRISTSSADDALDEVLGDAGAHARLEANGDVTWNRDANDQRVLDHVTDGTGERIDSIGEFPGWPAPVSGVAPVDTDSDGMPDVWEGLYGFDPGVPADPAADADGDGYTDLEEFLNGTDPNVAEPAACATRELRFVSKTRLDWSPATLATCGSRFDLARGTLSELNTTAGFEGATCVESGGANTSATDTTLPSPGDGLWYLSRVAGATWNTLASGQHGNRDPNFPTCP